MAQQPEEMVPVSIRMTRSSVERLKQLTGMSFSHLGRLVLMNLLRNAEAEHAKTQVDSVSQQLDSISKEVLNGN